MNDLKNCIRACKSPLIASKEPPLSFILVVSSCNRYHLDGLHKCIHFLGLITFFLRFPIGGFGGVGQTLGCVLHLLPQHHG